MTTNFGFGSLTGVNGKIDWETMKKYDKDENGVIDAREYHDMLNEMDPDGFNGVSLFGSVDKNHDGKISEEEFKIMEQKVAMAEHLDAKLEEMASSPDGLTPDCKSAAISYLKSYADSYMTAHPDNVDGMVDQFDTDLAAFFGNYQAGLDQIEDIKTAPDLGKKFMDAVKNGNQNGNISNSERAAIDSAATDYALQQILLKGDYSFLTSLGAKSSDISSIKVLVGKLYKSGNVKDNLDVLKNQIKVTINKCDEAKIIDKAGKIEADIAAAEAAKNAKPAAVYTVKALELDYTGIPGYKNNDQVKIENAGEGAAKGKAGELIEKLRIQIEDKVKAECDKKGLNFDKALVDSIFDSAKTATINSCVSGSTHNYQVLWCITVASTTESHFNIKTLIDTFVTNFNSLMTTATDKIAAPQADANGVPTFDNITTNYLDKPDKDKDGKDLLTPEQKALKAIQEELLSNPNATIGLAPKTGNPILDMAIVMLKKPNTDLAKSIVDTVSADVKAQMLKAGVSENVINNLLAASKDEVIAKVKPGTKKADLINDFITLVQQKYSDYKNNKGTGVTA